LYPSVASKEHYFPLTDLEQARSAEMGRFQKALQELESKRELRLSRIDVEMARRGLQNSDARRQAIFETRLDCLNQVILRRIEIRKAMARSYPELASSTELNKLMEAIQADVVDLRAECRKSNLIVPPEVFAELHARARDGIDGLKREMASTVPFKPKLPEFSLTISGGGAARSDVGPAPQSADNRSVPQRIVHSARAANPPIDAWDAVCGKVDEAIGDLAERNAKLSGALGQLATAIKEASRLAEQRTVYLEQVQFLAEQASRIPVLRRTSIVKGILVALRIGLHDVPATAAALEASVSLLIDHFGIGETGVNRAAPRH
jgi:hypothetical protein